MQIQLEYDEELNEFHSDTLLMFRNSEQPHKWVLMDKSNNILDTDKYRHDLAERNNLKLNYKGINANV